MGLVIARASIASLLLAVASAMPLTAGAVPVENLKGFEALFGRYAPGGDCKRQPQFVVDVAGFTFEVAGKAEKVTNAEYAASFGGNGYQGIQQWFFPFVGPQETHPILLTFNAAEKPGVVTVEHYDEGTPGGPKASARNAALVKGSPYAKCN
jgi:hypothetical protein